MVEDNAILVTAIETYDGKWHAHLFLKGGHVRTVTKDTPSELLKEVEKLQKELLLSTYFETL